MKFNYRKLLVILVAACLPVLAVAQQGADNSNVPMASLMRSNGKIYVVVAVLVIIFIGILFFLIGLEKRLRKLEKKAE